MVKTRRGNEVIFTATSYGRAGREETKRRWRKHKAMQDIGTGVTTPMRMVTTRAHAQLVAALATPPSVSRVVATTTPAQTTPRTLRPQHDGRRKPRCSDFGPSRHYAFQGQQGFFFCHPCDLWDALPPDASKKISGLSRMYSCTANHESFSHPTALCSDYGRKLFGAHIKATDNENDDDEYVADFDDSLDESNCSDTDASTKDDLENLLQVGGSSSPQVTIGGTTMAVTPALSPSRQNHDAQTTISGYEKEVAKLKQNISLLQRKNRYLKGEIKILRRGNVDMSESVNQQESIEFRNNHFKTRILGALNAVLYPFRHWKGPIVAKVVGVHLDGALQPHLLKLAHKHFCMHLFTP
jgi:hypothetical protein